MTLSYSRIIWPAIVLPFWTLKFANACPRPKSAWVRGSPIFDVILLDLGLPDSAGYETFSGIHQQAPKIPIVVLSGLEDEELAMRTVREGAQDYLVKDKLIGDLLLRSLRYSVERMRAKRGLAPGSG